MTGWFLEKLMILAYSRRTQCALVLGIIGFVLIQLFGMFVLENFTLNGPLSGLTDVIKQHLASRYDKIAWYCLFSFGVLAFNFYVKDSRKFHQVF